MDLIKIGKYIAEKRKGLSMTQRQLAEKLGMSDKSVSKWERGVCLPDVSVYSDLCLILGISIHEFLAGEDIPQENLIRKSEENIIGVAADSKQKQNRLKSIIRALLVLTVLVFSLTGFAVYREIRPQNFIGPVARDSIEMETAKLFSGPEGSHIYKFTTTDKYQSLRLYCSKYQAGKLIDQREMFLGFENTGSPVNGSILIFPDFDNYLVKLVVVADSAKYTTSIPILEDVAERKHYGQSASGILENISIQYGEELPLVALIYDNDELHVVDDIFRFMDESAGILEENDYVYYFSCAFCKE